jgi:hypothetical protein
MLVVVPVLAWALFCAAVIWWWLSDPTVTEHELEPRSAPTTQDPIEEITEATLVVDGLAFRHHGDDEATTLYDADALAAELASHDPTS